MAHIQGTGYRRAMNAWDKGIISEKSCRGLILSMLLKTGGEAWHGGTLL